jgi:hypothetical protein
MRTSLGFFFLSVPVLYCRSSGLTEAKEADEEATVNHSQSSTTSAASRMAFSTHAIQIKYTNYIHSS